MGKYDNYDNAVTVAVHKTFDYDERYVLGGKYTQPSGEGEFEGSREYGYRCFLYPMDNRDYTYLEITDLIAEASWEEDLDSAAMSLDLTVWDPVIQGNRDLNSISKGDRISLFVRDYTDDEMALVNNFVVWEIGKSSSSSPTITLKAYDNMIYLMKSEDTFLFNKSTSKSKKGWTASEITEYVCEKHGIETGYIAKAEHRISYFRVDSGNIYDVLIKAWTEERKKTDVRYLLRMENNKLTVRAKQDQAMFWQVAAGSNLIEIDFTDSLEGMFSAVRAVSAKQESNGTTEKTNESNTEGGDFAAPDGGGWYTCAASWYEVMEETGLACSGYSLSRRLRGFAELSNNWQSWVPIKDLDFAAMGGLSCGQKIEIKYNNKTIVIPKVDKGRGGSGIGNYPRHIDLTNAAWDQLVGAGNRSKGKVLVQWRVAGAIGGSADLESSSNRVKAGADKTAADVIAVHKDMVESYGYTQKLVSLDPNTKLDKAKEQAENALYEASRENYAANLTTYFLPFLRAGDPIHVVDEGTGLNGRYYCSDVSHQMSTSGSRTQIGLSWLDAVPEKEISEGEKKPRQTQQRQQGGSGTAPYGSPGGIDPGMSGCGAAVIAAGSADGIMDLPYSWGGGNHSGPSKGIGRGASTFGFDCSGFTAYCWWKGAGVHIPRFTDGIANLVKTNFGEEIPKGSEQIGDLLLYGYDPNQGGTRYGHVALCAGTHPMKTLESGGRNNGVGWTDRNDHILVVRVSKHCKWVDNLNEIGETTTDALGGYF